MAANVEDPYAKALEGWDELFCAAAKIQAAATSLKANNDTSLDGYNIERGLMKHKPALMRRHFDNLKRHIKERKARVG